VRQFFSSPAGLILAGFFLVVIGVLIPLGMVVGVIPAGFFLSFLGYFASLMGMITGLIGAAIYVKERRE
jgi:membrane associated rhomboid family serine protease